MANLKIRVLSANDIYAHNFLYIGNAFYENEKQYVKTTREEAIKDFQRKIIGIKIFYNISNAEYLEKVKEETTKMRQNKPFYFCILVDDTNKHLPKKIQIKEVGEGWDYYRINHEIEYRPAGVITDNPPLTEFSENKNIIEFNFPQNIDKDFTLSTFEAGIYCFAKSDVISSFNIKRGINLSLLDENGKEIPVKVSENSYYKTYLETNFLFNVSIV